MNIFWHIYIFIKIILGSHHVNLEGDLKKYKIDVNGKVLEATKVEHKDHEHAGHAHD